MAVFYIFGAVISIGAVILFVEFVDKGFDWRIGRWFLFMIAFATTLFVTAVLTTPPDPPKPPSPIRMCVSLEN